VIPIRVPSVRERPEDVPLLVQEFMLGRRRVGARPKLVTPGAMEVLKSHSWPGNVREVRNVVERLMIMVAGDEITPAVLDLPAVRWPLRAAP